MKKLLLLFFIASGFSAVSQTKPKPKPPVNGFGIQITARILDDCKKLSDLSFGEFHGTDSDVQNVTLNAKGEFAARYWLKEPGLFYFRKGGHTEYFMVSAKQELYKIDLSCTNDALNPLQIMSSPENKSYKAFSMLRKNLNTDLESYSKKSLDDVAAFEEFTNRIRNYQKALNLLMKQNPQSYAATYFAADRIGEKDLSSIQNLRLNYLKRQIFADQKFYNTPLPTYILENYFDYIADKSDNSFAVFEGLLNTASKNTEAAKRLQNVLYEAIFRSKRQELIAGYVNWAKAHPVTFWLLPYSLKPY